MQAISRLRLLADLVKADILPAAALNHIVESSGLRGLGNSAHLLRANTARYVASCPAVDQPAWFHTAQERGTAYAASPVLNETWTPRPELRTRLQQNSASFAAYLDLPVAKPSNLTFIVKKCKDLAVVSLNTGRSLTAASDFFDSITTLLGQHKHLQQKVFYVACASAAVQVAETAQAKGIWCWEQASQLVQSICPLLQPSWSSLDAYTSINIFQTLAKCHLQHGPLPSEVLDTAAAQVSRYQKRIDQQGISLAAWACASLYQRHNPTKYHHLLDQLTDRALQLRNPEIKLQHTATIIWSMAKSHYHPSASLLNKLTMSAGNQLHGPNRHAAQDIEMLFLGYAWLGYSPAPWALKALLGHFLEQPLQGHQASNMAWSLAVLGQLTTPVFKGLLSHVQRVHLEDVKLNRQLHFALDYLRPETAAGPEADEWRQVSEDLHAFWPTQPFQHKSRRIHTEVLEVLEQELHLKCRKNVSIIREHDRSLFCMDILIPQQLGVPQDIAVQVDGSDQFIHNDDEEKRYIGPAKFRKSMLSRHVPCLINIPYYEWTGRSLHEALAYLQDKLTAAGNCELSDCVDPSLAWDS